MAGIPKTFALGAFLTTLRSESDRACAVLGGAFLDSTLEDFLRAHLVSDAPAAIFSSEGALGSFNAKIEAGYVLGWLSRDERQDLHVIRRIRNDFAHAVDHELGFTSNHVKDRCNALILPRILLEEASVDLNDAPFGHLAGDPRWRFEFAVTFLRQDLAYRASVATHAQSPASAVSPQSSGEAAT